MMTKIIIRALLINKEEIVQALYHIDLFQE